MDKCEKCDMLLREGQYHPYAACIMYYQTRQSEKVDDFLRRIIAYGMWCEERGLNLNQAMYEVQDDYRG